MTAALPKKRKRPVAVTIVGTIALFMAIVSFFLGIASIWNTGIVVESQQQQLVIVSSRLTPEATALVFAVYELVAAAVTIVLMWGFLRLRFWAWISVMVWVGLGLAVQITRYFYGEPGYLRMFLYMLLLFALNQVEVREAFGLHRRGEDGDVAQSF